MPTYVIVLIIVAAVIAACATAFFGFRAYRRRKLAEQLGRRDGDQVR
ncbi:MAG TPA: diacylglycerol kinase, partial [Bifidobacterium sp.]|nr:diacylglycerol kinase [Bifidobacterium sp.]